MEIIFMSTPTPQQILAVHRAARRVAEALRYQWRVAAHDCGREEIGSRARLPYVVEDKSRPRAE